MSLKFKCQLNWNVAKNKIVTKSGISLQLKCHQNWNITKNEMSLKLKFHQNLNATKTEVSPKMKCYQNWNVAVNEMLLNLKKSLKNQRGWSLCEIIEHKGAGFYKPGQQQRLLFPVEAGQDDYNIEKSSPEGLVFNPARL